MDKFFADTVRLLLRIAPDVFANDIFAMKGGTAINLFVQNMPRLSVDIDVVYVPLQTSRAEALTAVQQELAAIEQRLAPQRLRTRLVGSKDLGNLRISKPFGDDARRFSCSTSRNSKPLLLDTEANETPTRLSCPRPRAKSVR